MSDSILFQEENYVVLQPGQPEEIVSQEELLASLTQVLQDPAIDLPPHVLALATISGRASYLLRNYCELDLGDGAFLHWYAVRLEKN
jgi:hypothetical protein